MSKLIKLTIKVCKSYYKVKGLKFKFTTAQILFLMKSLKFSLFS